MKTRKDLIPTPKYKNAIQNYGIGTLHQPNGDPVNGPGVAKQLASKATGQSYNDALQSRKQANRYGLKEIQEGQRSSSAY